ncbi:MAG TPA: hypothetical protein VK335_18405 [Bryobacteraceae bacterium]|nr:hypothetical protein [Bryobacteraceae bacterium]
MKKLFVLAVLWGADAWLWAADFPTAEISNGEIRAQVYLPDTKNGFYRATRFDWSGVVYSLQYHGHEYYGRWFQATDPSVHDFVYRGSDIVASPCTSITGPVDEFAPLGWGEAKPGGAFIKIGVGVLRKTDDGKYDNFKLYDIVDSGKWTAKQSPASVEFTQEVTDSSSGYGYSYHKTVRLVSGKPEMVLEHSLKNTGARAIRTRVYNHNFLVLDGQPPGPGLVITVPFQIQAGRPPDKKLAEIRGNQIVYLRMLENEDIAATSLQGFSDSPKDNDIRIENERLGAGVRITGDRPLSSESLWSIRAVMAMEPFVSVEIEPAKEFTWNSTYSYYTLPVRAK